MVDTASPRPHVLFRLGRQSFAVPLAAVKDVLRAPLVTPVPHAPAMVRGLTVLRQQLVTVMDMRLRLGLPARAADAKTVALAIDYEGERIALLVDRLDEVVALPPLPAAPEAHDPLWQHVIRGIWQRPQETVMVVDVMAIIDGAMPNAAE